MLFSFKSLFRCTVGIALISLTGCKFAPASAFVHLVNNAFELEGKPFFPIMLNYVAEFRYSENKYFLRNEINSPVATTVKGDAIS